MNRYFMWNLRSTVVDHLDAKRTPVLHTLGGAHRVEAVTAQRLDRADGEHAVAAAAVGGDRATARQGVAPTPPGASRALPRRAPRHTPPGGARRGRCSRRGARVPAGP